MDSKEDIANQYSDFEVSIIRNKKCIAILCHDESIKLPIVN